MSLIDSWRYRRNDRYKGDGFTLTELLVVLVSLVLVSIGVMVSALGGAAPWPILPLALAALVAPVVQGL